MKTVQRAPHALKGSRATGALAHASGDIDKGSRARRRRSKRVDSYIAHAAMSHELRDAVRRGSRCGRRAVSDVGQANVAACWGLKPSR